eukprot:TRINITY_DN5438_c0_g1_i6.p6 TRINITY_DN5438_c0_g1~~TRINITY_DN5438_c0_g1_i6.p6  ORF type:complete len:101 (+),score=13.95 TRINITY_DN5438_c0_g1_i6:577-879(+)
MFEISEEDQNPSKDFKFLKVPRYELQKTEGKLKLTVKLSNTLSLGEVDLQICAFVVMITTKEEKLRLDLPVKIDENKTSAKWVKKSSTLLVEMPVIQKLE